VSTSLEGPKGKITEKGLPLVKVESHSRWDSVTTIYYQEHEAVIVSKQEKLVRLPCNTIETTVS